MPRARRTLSRCSVVDSRTPLAHQAGRVADLGHMLPAGRDFKPVRSVRTNTTPLPEADGVSFILTWTPLCRPTPLAVTGWLIVRSNREAPVTGGKFHSRARCLYLDSRLHEVFQVVENSRIRHTAVCHFCNTLTLDDSVEPPAVQQQEGIEVGLDPLHQFQLASAGVPLREVALHSVRRRFKPAVDPTRAERVERPGAGLGVGGQEDTCRIPARNSAPQPLSPATRVARPAWSELSRRGSLRLPDAFRASAGRTPARRPRPRAELWRIRHAPWPLGPRTPLLYRRVTATVPEDSINRPCPSPRPTNSPALGSSQSMATGCSTPPRISRRTSSSVSMEDDRS